METARNMAMDSVAIVEQQNQKASSSLENRLLFIWLLWFT
jgi:hypothetical protein